MDKTLPLDVVFVRHILDRLYACGVRDICIAPGSRSTVLTLAVAYDDRFISHVMVDERSMGFYALGLSKGSGLPTAIITTSGTAVANIGPAFAEAYYSETPIVLLSADRPKELHDCGANQTIRQHSVFQNFSCGNEHIEPPETMESLSEHLKRIESALSNCVTQKGPVQLNLAFREPFSITPEPYRETLPSIPISDLSPDKSPVLKDFSSLTSISNGIIYCGNCSEDDGKAALEIAEYFQWPLLPDITSPLRRTTHPLIHHFFDGVEDAFLENCEGFLHLGKGITPMAFLKKTASFSKPYFHVLPNRLPDNPFHLNKVIFQESIRSFKNRLTASPRTLNHNNQQNPLRKNSPDSSDGFMVLISKQCAEHAVFIGNSLSVRTAQKDWIPANSSPKPIYTNRGCSGIDGLIATSAGIARSLKSPLVSIVGDLSAFHDLNSLSLISRLETAFCLVIFNNNGGGLFNALPISQQPDHFETFFKTPQNLSFEMISKAFDLPYFRVRTPSELEDLLTDKNILAGKSLIEIIID